MSFSPTVKKAMHDNIVRILSQGLMAEELYDQLNAQSQLNKSSLDALLAEMVKAGEITVSAGPVPRFKTK